MWNVFPPQWEEVKRSEYKQVGEGLQPKALNASLSSVSGVITGAWMLWFCHLISCSNAHAQQEMVAEAESWKYWNDAAYQNTYFSGKMSSSPLNIILLVFVLLALLYFLKRSHWHNCNCSMGSRTNHFEAYGFLIPDVWSLKKKTKNTFAMQTVFMTHLNWT